MKADSPSRDFQYKYYRLKAEKIEHPTPGVTAFVIESGIHEAYPETTSRVGMVLFSNLVNRATGETKPNHYSAHISRDFIVGLQGWSWKARRCKKPTEREALYLFACTFPEFHLPVPAWKTDEIVRDGDLRWDIDDNSGNSIVYQCTNQHHTGFGKYAHRPGLDGTKTDRFQIPWTFYALGLHMKCEAKQEKRKVA